ncbi:protein kinase domain-containing protein [Gordonia sp. NPDC003504]
MRGSPDAQIAGHRLAEIVGQGGMGTVYAAHHPRLPRMVALKVLNASVSADPAFRRRFQREAHLSAGLEHPHIVSVYDCGEDHGNLWISMRLVRGTSVAALVAGAPQGMPIPTALAILNDTARALDFGHRRGVVHRDVKPANILIDTEIDQTMLTDFGIARQIGTDDGLTAAGTFIGTFDYCSPEQMSGHDLDGRSDQYSLACMAVQMLTGCKPFQGPTVATVMKQHLVDPPPSVSAMRQGLSPAADPVIARGMAKHPQERFASCVEFVQALGAALSTPESVRSEPAEHSAAQQDTPDSGVGDAYSETVVAPATLAPAPDLHYAFVGDEQQFTYTLVGVTHTVTLRQIRATRDLPQHRVNSGDLGGWVASETNLSDQAWVGEDAWVVGDARVRENASVRDNAFVGDRTDISGTTRVDGNASVFGDATVSGTARISGDAEINGTASVSGSAWVYEEAVIGDASIIDGNSRICGRAKIGGHARVDEFAIVSDRCRISDRATVRGHARVGDAAIVSGSAVVDGRARIHGHAEVAGSAQISDDAAISGNARVAGQAVVRDDQKVDSGTRA